MKDVNKSISPCDKWEEGETSTVKSKFIRFSWVASQNEVGKKAGHWDVDIFFNV